MSVRCGAASEHFFFTSNNYELYNYCSCKMSCKRRTRTFAIFRTIIISRYCMRTLDCYLFITCSPMYEDKRRPLVERKTNDTIFQDDMF